MAMVNRKNIAKVSAERKFTDRVPFREAFRSKYNYAKSNLEAGTAPCVLSFYGVGGIGKTSLLKVLAKELTIEKQKDALYVYHDIHDDTSTDCVSILKRLRGSIACKYNYEFFWFDWGYYCYQKAIGEDVEKPETSSFVKDSKFLSCIIDLIKESPVPIPYGDWIVKAVDCVDKLTKFVSAADGGLTMVRQYIREHKKELTRMTTLDKDELYEKLPEYFAMDMERNLEKATEPFVFFVDTYEKLVNELSGVGNPLKDDLWLRDENGPIQNISKAIWVISGREMLKWKDIGDCGWCEADENNLEQHRIGELSERDSYTFLEDCGVDNEGLRKSLYNLTKGTPLYLDLCVTQYQNIKANNKEPVAEDFGKNTTQLVDRMLQYMNDDEKQMVYILSCLKKWDYDLFVSVIKVFNMSVINDKYDAIMSMSFIEEDTSQKDYYRINRVLGRVLFENCNERTKDGSLKAAIDFCLECWEDDPIHYAEMSLQYAVDYYEDDKELEQFYLDKFADYLSDLIYQGKANAAIAKNIFEPFSKRAEKDKKGALYIRKLNFLLNYYNANGEYKTSFEYARQAVELSKKLNGEDHPYSLTLMNNLALAYSALGEYEKACELHGITLGKRKEVLGENHRDTLISMNNLALVYSEIGEYEKALEFFSTVVEKEKLIFGDNNSETLISMDNLALTYSYLGEYQKAFEIQKEVLEKCKEVFGENHPDTLISMNNLASTYSDLGEYEKARELHTITLEKRKEVLGENHPDTLVSMNNLADTYSSLDEYEKAHKLYTITLEKRKEVLGENHPKTLISMYNLAGAYSDLSEYEKARELFNAVIEKQKMIIGENHPDTLLSMNNLADIYSDLNEDEKALEIYEEVVEKRKEVLGENHLDTLGSMNSLASVYFVLDENQKAIETYKEVLSKYKETLGESHLYTLNSMGCFAYVYYDIGEYEKSLALYRELYSKFKEIYGEENEHTQSIATRISELEEKVAEK